MKTAVILLLSGIVGCGSTDPAPAPLLAVVNEHHEALAVWRDAAAKGILKPETTLIHLDAHEDMGIPDDDDPELTVSNFIVPALREGLFKEVVWVVPPWLNEIRRVEKRAGFRFRIVRLDDLPEIEGPVALDIDLDFFACENPHADHRDEVITKVVYERLLATGRVRMSGEAEDDVRRTRSTVLARPPGRYSWPVRLDRVEETATGRVTYVKGCICMGEYGEEFPVHRPAPGEVERTIAAVKAALDAAGYDVRVVTVARSATSGFVPEAALPAIETAVLKLVDRDAFRR